MSDIQHKCKTCQYIQICGNKMQQQKWQGMAVAASILFSGYVADRKCPTPTAHLQRLLLLLSYLYLLPHMIQNADCTCIAPKRSLNNPTVEWPSLIRISVGNSASRRLFARKPSSGIICCSAPARPSVMTWARPFSVAATSRSKGFLEGSQP